MMAQFRNYGTSLRENLMIYIVGVYRIENCGVMIKSRFFNEFNRSKSILLFQGWEMIFGKSHRLIFKKKS